MKNRKWLWGLAALPLVGLPLIAQETSPPPPPASPPAEQPPPQESPEPVSEEKARPADERLSTDNSISFPVDI